MANNPQDDFCNTQQNNNAARLAEMGSIEPDGEFRVIQEEGPCEQCTKAGRQGTVQLAEQWSKATPDEKSRYYRCSNLACDWSARA